MSAPSSSLAVATITNPTTPHCLRDPRYTMRYINHCRICNNTITIPFKVPVHGSDLDAKFEEISKIRACTITEHGTKYTMEWLLWACWACDGGNPEFLVVLDTDQQELHVQMTVCDHCGMLRGSESIEYWWRSWKYEDMDDFANLKKSMRREGEVSGDEGEIAAYDWDEMARIDGVQTDDEYDGDENSIVASMKYKEDNNEEE